MPARIARRDRISCPGAASDEERAIVCALRRSTGFPLDALTFVVSHFLPHLNRDAVYRILKAEGLNWLPPSDQARKPHGTFKDYEVGFVHVDVKHLPKLRDRDGSTRKRYLYVAIDRASRYVHLAVKDDETTASAVAFLTDALDAFPFRVTHVLTDRGSCFTADAFEAACRAARGTSSQDAPLHAEDQRHGRALQRPGAAGGAGHHDLQPRRPGDRAARLQRGLQRPPAARAERALARDGVAPASRSRSRARQPNIQTA